MADPRASRFWITSIQSGLLDVASLTSCWEAIPPDKRDVVEHLDRRLARQAILHNYLTLWQAQQLLAGRTSGFQVDRYVLQDLIGHGGMGRVYLARDSRLNRLVALKILAPERMSNPRAIARFQREARVGAQLQHENLVRIYDFGEANGRFFLVMEYIEGKTIGALISAHGPFPPRTAAGLARQVALGLEHAHRKGLIHRDVNPYNVLVTRDGIAKLADLGLAIDLAEEERVTREGATVGTFDYVAPEQARHSHAADIRSDIYSLGCTLYHMIAGQVPFPSPSLPEKLFAHQALEPTPLGDIIPEIPQELVEVVRRMMRKQPHERYATPLLVAQALEPFIEDQARLDDARSEPTTPAVDDSREVNASAQQLQGVSREAPSPSLKPVKEPAPPNSTSALATPTTPPGLTPTPAPVGGWNSGASPTSTSQGRVANLRSTDDVPLSLDLGPEPSLSDSLARAKPRSRQVQLSADGRLAARWLLTQVQKGVAKVRPFAIQHKRHAPVAAGVVLVLVIGSAIVYSLTRPTGETSPAEASQRKAGGASVAGAQDPSAKVTALSAPIMVVGADGEARPAGDFAEAIKMALGAKGWIELYNHEPLVISGLGEAVTAATRGSLKIRAGNGAAPVLNIDVKGQQPPLTIGSGTSLVLEGLVIAARYTDQAKPGAAKPIIHTAGPTQFRNCRFELRGDEAIPGSRSVVVEGNNLLIENCSFEGWDIAIEVLASGGSVTELENAMILPGRGRGSTQNLPNPGQPGGGWGVKMEFYPGVRSSLRQLILRRCTVVGHGLLQISGFSRDAPLQVEAKECAVQSSTLVGWVSGSSNLIWDSRMINWRGDGNQLEVKGASWISRLGQASAAAGETIVDREKWRTLMIERHLNSSPIQFSGNPGAAGYSGKLDDFKVKPTGQGEVGANPLQVGPRSLPE